MCGIAGIIGEVKNDNIRNMVAAMRHRGPDDEGIYVDRNVSIGMARLAIIDTGVTGHQPMSDEKQNVWIVYNGETYNFKSEKIELEKKGYKFKSASDTEVVLHMYLCYGEGFLDRMRGIFALAIYDKRGGIGRERLLLARDHLGVKPLLYATVGSSFVFASEMKAMLASGLVERVFDAEALRLLLTYGSITQPRTAISGVKMLMPGHKLIIESGNEKIERFWKLSVNRRPELASLPYEELVRVVRGSIEESVRMQMISDVPVGAFLSGGVDSTLLVALMSRISTQKVKTFSVGFEQEGAHIDETDDAYKAARFIGTDHTRVLVTGKDVREKICHVVTALDQPTVDGVNTYFVSAAARKSVTVAISGTGGDELFTGYPWFIDMALRDAVEKKHILATKIKSYLASVGRASMFDGYVSGRAGYAVELVRALSGFVPKYSRIYNIFGAHGAAAVLSGEIKAETNVGRESSLDVLYSDELSEASPVERVSALCLRGYTQNQLLRDIDAVSMAHSLEVRVPFLDHAMVDMALSLPQSAKLGNIGNRRVKSTEMTYRESGSKKILIAAGGDLLPKNIDLQVKRGFGMPFESWLNGPMRDVMEDALSDKAVRNRNYFNTKEIKKIKKDFYSGTINWSKPWLLMITELWCREFIDRSEKCGI